MKLFDIRIFACAAAILCKGKLYVSGTQEIGPYLLGNNAWYDDSSLNQFWGDMDTAGFKTIRRCLSDSCPHKVLKNYQEIDFDLK